MNELIRDFMKFLDGKKTHICAIILGITAVLYSHGMIDELTKDILTSVFGVGGVMALRAGIKKIGSK